MRPLRLWFPALLLLGCFSGAADEAASRAAATDQAPTPPEAMLTRGFLVWESNRSGAWRIWTRQLAGGAARQLTPETPGRDHCCPHISPDGSSVVYATVRPGLRSYARGGKGAELRLIRPDGSGDRQIRPRVRTYFENRVVVWRSPTMLNFIDGARHSASLDLESGAVVRLTERPGAPRGHLLDRKLRWATTGIEGFYRFDRKRRALHPDLLLTGCQFYFSHDGRFGYWMAGPGGPLKRVALGSGEVAEVLRRGDTRVPDELGYLYFPMLSRDGRLLAFSGSRGSHGHFDSDYEIFVAVADPKTMMLTSRPVRYTHHPATDRYPDVHLERLRLGRSGGEAPFAVRLRPRKGVTWEWSWGDGTTSRGRVGSHSYPSPGRYEVEARSGARRLRGIVAVTAPAVRPAAAVASGASSPG